MLTKESGHSGAKMQLINILGNEQGCQSERFSAQFSGFYALVRTERVSHLFALLLLSSASFQGSLLNHIGKMGGKWQFLTLSYFMWPRCVLKKGFFVTNALQKLAKLSNFCKGFL